MTKPEVGNGINDGGGTNNEPDGAQRQDGFLAPRTHVTEDEGGNSKRQTYQFQTHVTFVAVHGGAKAEAAGDQTEDEGGDGHGFYFLGIAAVIPAATTSLADATAAWTAEAAIAADLSTISPAAAVETTATKLQLGAGEGGLVVVAVNAIPRSSRSHSRTDSISYSASYSTSSPTSLFARSFLHTLHAGFPSLLLLDLREFKWIR